MTAMAKTFNVGDHVRWNSEAGRVSGVIIKKITSDTKFKGYMHHASREATALRLVPTKKSAKKARKK